MPRKVTSLPEDPVVTPEELATELKIPLGTIYQWSSRGTGPTPFRPGGRQLRYRRSEVNRWLAECGDTSQRSAVQTA